jgi:hypothetical protein
MKLYEVHGTQGQGSMLFETFNNLKDALKYVKDHKGEASFGIKYPSGRWCKFCPYCKHSLKNNLHGNCTYCKICNPQLKGER